MLLGMHGKSAANQQSRRWLSSAYPQVAFDVFAILLAGLNALDQPRRYQHEILVSMRRDGAFFFVVRLPALSTAIIVFQRRSRLYSVRFV